MENNYPNVSKYYFKYGPINYVETTLKNKTLHFSRLEDFNDIYENDYRLTHYFNSRKDAEKLLEPVQNSIRRIRSQIDEKLSNCLVTCFSRNPNISLMWSHYSQNHAGICYVFRQDGLNRLFPNQPLGAGPINYSNFLPEVNVFQEYTTEGMLSALIPDIVLTKPAEWSYEEEFRVFGFSLASNAIPYSPEGLAAIIVGRRVNQMELDKIKTDIAEYNEKNSTECEIWYSVRTPATFRLAVTNNEGLRNSGETAINDRIPILPNAKPKKVTTLDEDE